MAIKVTGNSTDFWSIGEEGTDSMLNLVNKVGFDRAERSLIVEAGAEIVEKHLYDHTPYLDNEDVTHKELYGYSVGHIRDGITHKPNQFFNGATEVGFNRKVYPIVAWTDWGTYRQPAQFWFEKAAASLPYGEVYAAQRTVAMALLKKKGVI